MTTASGICGNCGDERPGGRDGGVSPRPWCRRSLPNLRRRARRDRREERGALRRPPGAPRATSGKSGVNANINFDTRPDISPACYESPTSRVRPRLQASRRASRFARRSASRRIGEACQSASTWPPIAAESVPPCLVALPLESLAERLDSQSSGRFTNSTISASPGGVPVRRINEDRGRNRNPLERCKTTPRANPDPESRRPAPLRPARRPLDGLRFSSARWQRRQCSGRPEASQLGQRLEPGHP